jgi:hypothetical protein
MAAVLACASICVSARIEDVAVNLTLAVANPIQIRNRNTQLFAKTGKPKIRKQTLHRFASWVRDGEDRRLGVQDFWLR